MGVAGDKQIRHYTGLAWPDMWHSWRFKATQCGSVNELNPVQLGCFSPVSLLPGSKAPCVLSLGRFSQNGWSCWCSLDTRTHTNHARVQGVCLKWHPHEGQDPGFIVRWADKIKTLCVRGKWEEVEVAFICIKINLKLSSCVSVPAIFPALSGEQCLSMQV